MSHLSQLWTLWEELNELLSRIAEDSALPVWQQEYAVDTVLLGLASALRSFGSPDDVLSYVVISMGRALSRLRKRRSETTGLDLENFVEPEDGESSEFLHLSHDEFWDWIHDNRSTMEPNLTALEWRAILVTEDAETIAEAAKRLDRPPRDYRNLRNRGSKKIFRKIRAGSVPPPPQQCH